MALSDSIAVLLCRAAMPMLASLLLLGCTAAQEPSLSADAPEGQVEGILKATREMDSASVPQLVQLLDSDDPLVRMLSIRSLERLTGQTFGYRHAAPRHERRRAVERWVEAVESGEFKQDSERGTGA